MSSKKPVSRFRHVVNVKKKVKNPITTTTDMERQHTTKPTLEAFKNIAIMYYQGHHKKLHTLSPPSAAPTLPQWLFQPGYATSLSFFLSLFSFLSVPFLQEKGRDPRFDERCGKLNQDLFEKSYAFLEEVKQEEKTTLQKEAKKTRSLQKKEKIRSLLHRMVCDS